MASRGLGAGDVRALVENAGRLMRPALESWHGAAPDNAPAERNFSLHLAIAATRLWPEVRCYAEPTLDLARNHGRLDLLLHEPNSRTLIAVEVKRVFEKSPLGLITDLERISQLTRRSDLPRSSSRWGLVLASTTRRYSAEWWKTCRHGPPPGKRSEAWCSLAATLAETARIGARGWETVRDEDPKRFLMWLAWRC